MAAWRQERGHSAGYQGRPSGQRPFDNQTDVCLEDHPQLMRLASACGRKGETPAKTVTRLLVNLAAELKPSKTTDLSSMLTEKEYLNMLADGGCLCRKGRDDASG